MKNKIVLPLLIAPFIFACNKTNFKPIDDEDAKILVKVIDSKQEDTLKTIKAFTLKNNETFNNESKDIESGYSRYSYTLDEEWAFDESKLCLKHYTNETESDSRCEIETYQFFNKNDNKFYVCTNSNGYKYRTVVSSVTQETAVSHLKEIINDSGIVGVITQNDYLNNFDGIVDQYKELKEKYKDSKDESFTYSLSSADEKSIQVIKDSQTKIDSTFNEGKIIEGLSLKIVNDLLQDVKKTHQENTTLKEDSKFYSNSSSSESSSFSTSASISVPNINDYKDLGE